MHASRFSFSVVMLPIIGLLVSGCLLSEKHLPPESARFPIEDHKWLADGGLILENDRKTGWIFHAQDNKFVTVNPVDIEKRKLDTPFTMELYRNTLKGDGHLIAVRKVSKTFAYIGIDIRRVSNSTTSQVEFTTFDKADEDFSSWEQIQRKFSNPDGSAVITKLHIEQISATDRAVYLSWPKSK